MVSLSTVHSRYVQHSNGQAPGSSKCFGGPASLANARLVSRVKTTIEDVFGNADIGAVQRRRGSAPRRRSLDQMVEILREAVADTVAPVPLGHSLGDAGHLAVAAVAERDHRQHLAG